MNSGSGETRRAFCLVALHRYDDAAQVLYTGLAAGLRLGLGDDELLQSRTAQVPHRVSVRGSGMQDAGCRPSQVAHPTSPPPGLIALRSNTRAGCALLHFSRIARSAK